MEDIIIIGAGPAGLTAAIYALRANKKVIGIKNLKTKKQVITSKNKYDTKSIIIATGVQTRKLGLKNENELIGKGVSYCDTYGMELYLKVKM